MIVSAEWIGCLQVVPENAILPKKNIKLCTNSGYGKL